MIISGVATIRAKKELVSLGPLYALVRKVVFNHQVNRAHLHFISLLQLQCHIKTVQEQEFLPFAAGIYSYFVRSNVDYKPRK